MLNQSVDAEHVQQCSCLLYFISTIFILISVINYIYYPVIGSLRYSDSMTHDILLYWMNLHVIAFFYIGLFRHKQLTETPQG